MIDDTLDSARPEDKLGEWSDAFDDADRRMHELTDGLTREQVNFKPAPRRWSVGKCVDHLSVSMRVYLDFMEPALNAAQAEEWTGSEPYGRGPLLGRMLLRALRKPGARYPAPKLFWPRPSPELEPGTVREHFETELVRLRSAVERSEGLALGRIKMPWPVFGLIKLSLAQAFELQALHIHRHLDQAERVKRDPGFPEGSGTD